jgi:hypothetical protein
VINEPAKASKGLRNVPLKGLRIHEVLAKMPRMPAEQLQAFVADVKANRVTEPITVQKGGIILHGRHRFEAAKACGHSTIPAIEVDLPPEEQVLYIYRTDGLRKHLNDDQRAVLAARYYEVVSRQSRANRASKAGKAGGRGRPKKPDSSQGTSSQELSVTEPAPQSEKSALIQVAALHNLTPSKLRNAINLNRADTKLADQVIAGEKKLLEANRQLQHAQGKHKARRKPNTPRQEPTEKPDPKASGDGLKEAGTQTKERGVDQQASEEVHAAAELASSEPQPGAAQELLPESTMPREVEAGAQAKEDAADQQINEEVKAPAELTSSESLPVASQESLPESAKPPCSGQVERGSTERADTAAGEGDREEAEKLMALWNAVSKPARKLFLEAALSDPETREMIRGLRVISEANNL